MKTHHEYHPKKLIANLKLVWDMFGKESKQDGIYNLLALPMAALALLLAFFVLVCTATDVFIMLLEFIYLKTKGKKANVITNNQTK